MNIALIIICIAAMVLLGRPEYLSDGTMVARMLTYHFFHVGWLHLAINAMATYSIFHRKHKDNVTVLIASYVIASVTYYMCSVSCLGISNMLYAAIGLRTPSLSSSWWKQPAVATFFIVTLAMLFIPGISGLTHIVALGIGMLAASIRRISNEV